MKNCPKSLTFLILVFSLLNPATFYASSTELMSISQPTVGSNDPVVTPAPPPLNAKAFMLIDVDSGKIIAEKNVNENLPPASLTKLMTLYVISKSLHNQQIHLTDMVRVSQEAWKIGGSRMFVKQGQSVSVEDLLKGIIVDSGNDACVAMAEHLGGSEQGFTEIMNQQAKSLGMTHSHFTDSTGMPDPNHYTSAHDLAILSRALITDFPQYYHWYKQKWFTFNGIRQPNRNRLLWRDGQVDGLKTGHTNEAGFCLVSSAKRNGMRLLAVVLNSPTDAARADDSERLLNYGFRFFETHKLYDKEKPVTELPVYKGQTKAVRLGFSNDFYLSIPTGQYKRLSVNTKTPSYLVAPIKKGTEVGELVLQLDNQVYAKHTLLALDDVEEGSLWTRIKDAVRLLFKRWFGS